MAFTLLQLHDEKKRQSYFNWGVGFQYLSGQLTTRVASYEARKRGAKSR